MVVSASVCSIGAIKSSTGLSNLWRNAADTRRGPALMATGGLTMFIPFGSDSSIIGSISRSATRSPSIEISICSPFTAAP
jgi:hypothetical protein